MFCCFFFFFSSKRCMFIYVKPCLCFVSTSFSSPVPCLIISLFHLLSVLLKQSPVSASLPDYRSPCAWSNPAFPSLLSSVLAINLVLFPFPLLPCHWRMLLPIWYGHPLSFCLLTTDFCLNPLNTYFLIYLSVNDHCQIIDLVFGCWIKNLFVWKDCLYLRRSRRQVSQIKRNICWTTLAPMSHDEIMSLFFQTHHVLWHHRSSCSSVHFKVQVSGLIISSRLSHQSGLSSFRGSSKPFSDLFSW